MTEAEDFSHGSYGDYSGVSFYGPPENGFWFDRLAVSDRFIRPLFLAILDRSADVLNLHAPAEQVHATAPAEHDAHRSSHN